MPAVRHNRRCLDKVMLSRNVVLGIGKITGRHHEAGRGTEQIFSVIRTVKPDQQLVFVAQRWSFHTGGKLNHRVEVKSSPDINRFRRAVLSHLNRAGEPRVGLDQQRLLVGRRGEGGLFADEAAVVRSRDHAVGHKFAGRPAVKPRVASGIRARIVFPDDKRLADCQILETRSRWRNKRCRVRIRG